MPLFQQAVLNKHIQELNTQHLESAYNRFIANFGNPEKQNNIRQAKEEQYQEGFLRELFVEVLGYTINPQPDYNLSTEYKNEKDAKKADGAIIKESKPIAIIELKGTDTIDLDTVEQQAFNYKNNQSNCKYIITSNFEKLRFYIENAIEYEEFELFNLSKESFALLFLCLSKDNLLNDLPLKIKQASLTQEENITKKLYSDYSTFKHLIFSNIVELNPQYDKLLLYKKTQKLLDRFLFIFFAEDRLLLPPNSIREILKQWEQLKALDNYIPLYDRFKKYFGYLNVGYKGKEYEIFAYNGGLFEPDEVLDNIKVDDQLLFINTLKLSDYDYETDVDVNILGHIFEHSLNEIEEVQAELEGQTIKKNKTKRKKDGIFYTPKYITKYIVDNALGTLCDEKKTGLAINEDEFSYTKRKEKRKELIEKLDTYRSWLLKLTICDPACGSGAFLNQALNYLLSEHKIIDELQAKVTGSSIVFPDIENTILENNLYGVDLNDESVEIAKLSLWLRTAQKGRKLTSLNKNIKCGNSLIDDPAVAGDKAFNWQKEFPEVFANGGFDVVIGNPPYGANLNFTEKEYIKDKYFSMEGDFDTYLYFVEKSFLICKQNGQCGFIIPNNLLQQKFGRNLRKALLEKTTIRKIIDLGMGVFNDAVIPTLILHYKLLPDNGSNKLKYSFRPSSIDIENNLFELPQKDFYENDNFTFNIQVNKNEKELIKKLERNSKKLSEVCELKIGIEGAPEYIGNFIKSEISKPLVRGRNFNRYFIDFESDPKYIEYERKLLHRPREERLFDCPRKILIRQTGDKIIATIDENRLYAWKSVFVILSDEIYIKLEYLLGLLNSSLFNFYYQKLVGESGRVFAQVKGVNLDKLPIKIIPIENQLSFSEKVNTLFLKNKELHELKTKFIKLLLSKYCDLKISNKLENWNELDFKGFSKELEKQKIKLTLTEQSEWLEYFEKEKAKAQEIKAIIEKTDKEIDTMVYKLYELTDEEIGIIENKE